MNGRTDAAGSASTSIANGGTDVAGSTSITNNSGTSGLPTTGGSSSSTSPSGNGPIGCAGISDTYFCEDFESGLGKWELSGLDWGVSVSDSRSATHSFTESPNGNYLEGADCSATLKGAVDLRGATAPVLEFWHKLSLERQDKTYIDASVDGKTWEESLSLKSYASSDNNNFSWTQQRISLSAWIGKPVYLRFRVYDWSTDFQADGWLLDDVVVRERIDAVVPHDAGGCPAATTTRYFCDNFDSGLGNWLASGSDWGLDAKNSRSGNSLSDAAHAPYVNGLRAEVELTGVIDLTTAVSPELVFWHTLRMDLGDQALIQVSKDGLNWETWKKYSNADNTSTWALKRESLSAYQGQKIRLRIHAKDTINPTRLPLDGWRIDDLEIRESP